MHDELSFNPYEVMEMSPIYGAQVKFSRHIALPAALALGGGAALGGLLGKSKKSKVKIPQQVSAALSSLLGIAQLGTPSLPVQQTPGIDPASAEGLGLERLRGAVTGGPSESFEDAKRRIIEFIDQPGDISQRPEFQAIIRAAKDQGNEAVNQVLRRIQLSGLSGSTPQGLAVGRQVGRSQENLLGQLAPFAEAERNRRFNALNQLLNIGQFETQLPFQQAEAGLQLDPTRRIADVRAEREFAQRQQTALFPFREQADVFSRILGGGAQLTTVQDPSTSTPFSGAVGGATAVAKLLPFIFPDKKTPTTKKTPIAKAA